MAGGWAMGMAPSYDGIDAGIGAWLGNMLLSAMSCRNGRPVYDHHTETLDASPSFLVFEARNSSMIRIDVDPGRFLSSRVPKNGSSGTDGFGFADTRGAARRFFHVDTQSIVVAVIEQLARRGEIKREAPREAFERYQLDSVTAAGTGTVGGDA